jgi:hypothetical protein
MAITPPLGVGHAAIAGASFIKHKMKSEMKDCYNAAKLIKIPISTILKSI